MCSVVAARKVDPRSRRDWSTNDIVGSTIRAGSIVPPSRRPAFAQYPFLFQTIHRSIGALAGAKSVTPIEA